MNLNLVLALSCLIFLSGSATAKTPVGLVGDIEVPDPDPNPNPPLPSNEIVYAAGNSFTVNGQPTPKMWIDGQGVRLEEPGLPFGWAYSIAVADNLATGVPDIYVAGTAVTASYSRPAVLWKNGLKSFLPCSVGVDCEARSVHTTSAGDVHVAGSSYASQRAATWLNNSAAVDLAGSFLQANSIFVSQANTYVVASGYGLNDPSAKLWTNNVMLNLSPGISSQAESVFVVNQTKYVAGSRLRNGKYQAMYWRVVANNIVPVFLSMSPSSNSSIAKAIFVDQNVVYVAGYETDANNVRRARLWRNGVSIPLGSADGHSVANTVFVSNSVVYVGGGIYQGCMVPHVWKDSIPEQYLGTNPLPGTADGCGEIKSIYVK
jgi:hypothetical protein